MEPPGNDLNLTAVLHPEEKRCFHLFSVCLFSFSPYQFLDLILLPKQL